MIDHDLDGSGCGLGRGRGTNDEEYGLGLPCRLGMYCTAVVGYALILVYFILEVRALSRMKITSTRMYVYRPWRQQEIWRSLPVSCPPSACVYNPWDKVGLG